MPIVQPSPKAVLFDLDGTLADRAAGLARYAELFAEDFRDRLEACSVGEVHAQILAVDEYGSPAQARSLCARLTWRAPMDPVLLHAHWTDRFGAACTPFGDVAQVMAALQARNIKLGLITNGGSAMQRAKIRALGLDRVMSVVAISQELGLEKPDPAIFHHALAALDCPPDRAWFVGDHPEIDVRGAVGAGLAGFWVRTGVAWSCAVAVVRSAGLSGLGRRLTVRAH
jgi:HAD superfamily hydrolase (TIGR01549 family)